MGTEISSESRNGATQDLSKLLSPEDSMRSLDDARAIKPTRHQNDADIEDFKRETSNDDQQVQLSDFIGEHGAYQLAVTALLFIRYVFLGLMANSGPLMTPDVTFYCSLPMNEILSIMPNISDLTAYEREMEIKEEFKQICQIDLRLYQNQSSFNESKSFRTSPLGKSNDMNLSNLTSTSMNQTARIRECVDFTYEMAPDQGRTMTSEFDLVCDRDWLRSLFQSLLSAAIVVAHVFWGTFSDKYGRFQAQRICLVVSLVAGLLSIFAMDFWTFTLARSICSFGDLGLVVSQTTTVVELVGQRYRGSSVALVNFGFALGVSLLPYLMAYFEDFRLVVGFTVLCHLVTMPFILATKESPRWLLTNMKFKEARKELKSIARWNQACNNFWTSLRVSSFSEKDKDQPWSQDRENSKLSPTGQKARFELLFSKFIDQIESQNLYDPVADAASSAINASKQSSPVRSSPRPAIVQQPRQSVASLSPSNDRGVTHQDTIVETTIEEHVAPMLSERPEVSSNQSQLPIDQTSRSDISRVDTDEVDNSELNKSYESDRELIAALDGQCMRRAISCYQLEAVKNPEPQIDSRNIQSAMGNHKESAKWATFVSPATSTGEECDNDSHFQPIRRLGRSDGQQTQPADCITSCHIVAHQLSFVGRVSGLFKDKKLMIAVFTIVWTTFNSELLYSSFIIINLEVGEDLYLNYILGGCMEALAAVSASLLLSYSPRRVSLMAFWLLISMSCFGLSLAHIDSTWAVWMLALAKFSQSSLSSIASVAAYESFPTFLRQSGSGLIFTLGMMGSVFAPLIFAEFDDHAGMDRVLMTFSFSSLVAACLIYLFLNETRGCELM